MKKTLTTDAARHFPLRSCIACRKKDKKQALLRLVRTPASQVEIDLQQRKPGRGCYLCYSRACFEMACKRKQVQRHLGVNPPTDFLNSLIDLTKSNE